MAFFPDSYNPRDDVVGFLSLVKIYTTLGEGNFLIGDNITFTDMNGTPWYGCKLIKVSRLQSAINGIAPTGEIKLSFIQDPEDTDLITELQTYGDSTIKGQKIEFYIQPINAVEDFYAPKLAPQLFLTRIMRSVRFSSSGAQEREAAITFESWSERRNAARNITYSTVGHSELIGYTNPSLEFMPTTDFKEQKLF